MQKSDLDYDTYTPGKLKALLKKTNENLEFLKSAIESISCGFIFINLEARINFVNKFTYQLFQKNVEGMLLEEVLPEHLLRDRILAVIKDGNGDVIKGEVCPFVDAKNENEIMYFLITLFPHMIDKKIVGWLLMIQNYTERFHEQNLQHRTETLSSMHQVSSSIAHEIKNPLGAISIHLQLLSKNLKKIDCERVNANDLELSKDKMLNCISVIEEEIENMNNVIGVFLNSLKNQKVEFKRHDVNEIIKSLVVFITPDLEQKNIVCHLDLYQESLPISCSSSSISHVILNVVKNAMEEMVDGGEIKIKSYLKGSRVIVSISDTGNGIPDDKLEIIFNPYMTSKENGIGIGLAISDRIMQVHRGRILVDPSYKDGARFILDFPAIANEQHLLNAPEGMSDDNSETMSYSTSQFFT